MATGAGSAAGKPVLAAEGSTASTSATPPLIRLASVTTIKDGGLLQDLLPPFETETGHRVHIYIGDDVYTQARAGKADVVFSHFGHKDTQAFVMQGLGQWPRTVLFNSIAPGRKGQGTPQACKGGEAAQDAQRAPLRSADVSRTCDLEPQTDHPASRKTDALTKDEQQERLQSTTPSGPTRERTQRRKEYVPAVYDPDAPLHERLGMELLLTGMEWPYKNVRREIVAFWQDLAWQIYIHLGGDRDAFRRFCAYMDEPWYLERRGAYHKTPALAQLFMDEFCAWWYRWDGKPERRSCFHAGEPDESYPPFAICCGCFAVKGFGALRRGGIFLRHDPRCALVQDNERVTQRHCHISQVYAEIYAS